MANEIKRLLKFCPDYDGNGNEAYIIEPENSWKDVLRLLVEDLGGQELVFLAKEIAKEYDKYEEVG